MCEARVLKLQTKLPDADPAHKKRLSERRGFSMRRAVATVVLAGVLVAAGAVPSMAQMARTFDDLRAEAHRGQIVSVTDQGGATTKGRVLRISANSIALVVKNETREWPASEVTWITQRRGSAGRDRTGRGGRDRAGAGRLGQWS